MVRRSSIYVAQLGRAKALVFALAALLFVLGGVGMQRVVYDPNVLTYFDDNAPDFVAFREVEELFGRSNEIVFLVKARRGTVFDPSVLPALGAIEERASSIAGVMSVRSLLDLVELDATTQQPEGPAIAAGLQAVTKERGAELRALLSADATVAAVAAFVPRSVKGDTDVTVLAAAARRVASEVEAAFPVAQVLLTGRIIIDDAFQTEGRNDFLGPPGVSLLVTTALLVLALGSFTATAALIAVVFVATVVTIGGLGWAGLPLNGISSAAPSVLVGLTVATGVHMVLAWQDALRDGNSRVDAVARAMDWNTWPIVLSVATTIVSFLCLNLATSPPFRQLGNIVALGLLVTLVLCFTLLPALLLVIPPSLARRRRWIEEAMARLGQCIAMRQLAFAGLGACVTAAAIAGLTQVTYDDTFSHYFDESYEVRQATDLFEEKLTGTTILAVSVPAASEGDAGSPQDRAVVSGLLRWLRAQPGVARVTSPFAGQPSNPAMRMIDDEASHMRLEVVLRGVSAAETLALAAATEIHAAESYDLDVVVTGLPILSARLSLDSARTMLLATMLALLAVSVLLLLAVRNVRLGLVSVIPNLVPMIIAFGVWGVLVGEVSFAATVVAALTFGIVVDDTVHIVLKFRRARSQGLAPDAALISSFRSVGVAVLVTTMAIGTGFATFAASGFLVNQHFGMLSTLTLASALVADLLFLPPLLLWAERERSVASQRQ